MPYPLVSRSWQVVDFAELEPVDCPCGEARRAFAEVAEYPATLHRTEISANSRLHYHRTLTETYYFLECSAGSQMQLDDELVPVHAGMALVIPPGVRHRAIGRMTVLIFVLPKFDPNDEWFDEPEPHGLG